MSLATVAVVVYLAMTAAVIVMVARAPLIEEPAISDAAETAAVVPELPAGTLRHGWVWGWCIGSTDWLTIESSAYEEPVLAADLGAAGAAPEWIADFGPVLAYVAEVPYADAAGPRKVDYRLLTIAAQQECDECGAAPGEPCRRVGCQGDGL